MICGQAIQKHNSPSHKTKPNQTTTTTEKNLTNRIEEEGASNKNRLFRTSRLFLNKRQRKAMISECTFVMPADFRRVQIIFLALMLSPIDIIRVDSHAANQITMHR